MLRKPAQRVISAYNYNMHGSNPRTPKNASLPEFALGVLGFQVRYLSRGFDICKAGRDHVPSLAHDWTVPTDAEVELAKARLHNGVPFVGLTDEWPLSVCLLHAMFGGTCMHNDFMNIRPGDAKSQGQEGYDESLLEGVKDPYDEAIYAEAAKIFHQRLQR